MTNTSNKLLIKSVASKLLIVGWFILTSAVMKGFSQSSDVFPIPETYKVEGIPTINNAEVKDLFYDLRQLKVI